MDWTYTPGCERPPETAPKLGVHAWVPNDELAKRRAIWDAALQKRTPADEAGAERLSKAKTETSAVTSGAEPSKGLDVNLALHPVAQGNHSAGDHSDAIEVSNEEFLAAIFGDSHQMAHVTAFDEAPDQIPQDQAARCWGGGWYSQKARSLGAHRNTYFTISLFTPYVDEVKGAIPRRRKALFERGCCVVVDDVGTKVDANDARLLSPSWSLETSPGNFQWGYILDGGETDRTRMEGLVNAMVARGLAAEGKDPGMKGVTRYVRLPQGSNRKSSWLEKLGPGGWRCQMRGWNPQLKFTIFELAEGFGITEDELVAQASAEVSSLPRNGVAPSDDPVLKAFEAIGSYKEARNDGWHDVTCPNIDQHTGGDDSGSAVRVNADGSYGYECHHGHCVDTFRFPQVLEYFEREHPELGLAATVPSRGGAAEPSEFPDYPAEAKTKRDYIFSMIDGAEFMGICDDDLKSMVAEQLLEIQHAKDVVAEVVARMQAKVPQDAKVMEQQLGVKDDSRVTSYPYNVSVLKPYEFVVDGFLGIGLAVIAGMPGIGKTSLLVPLAAAVAHLFDSPLAPVLRRKVIYFSESPRQVESVLYGLAKKAPGAKPHEFTEWFTVVPSHRLRPERLAKVITRAVRDNTVVFNGYKVAPLIVLDTSNATVDLENENDNSEVGKAIAAIKENLGTGACWLVQHIAKSLKRADVTEMTARGAGAFGGDAEATAFVFAEDEIPNKRFMWLDKHRFEAAFREVEFITTTDSETVQTPWQTSQTITYRVGLPAPSNVAARKAAVEEVKEQKQESRRVDLEREIVIFLAGAGACSKRKISDGIGGKAKLNYEVINQLVDEGRLIPTGERKGGADIYVAAPDPDFDDVSQQGGKP
jgi:hypothetical protein